MKILKNAITMAVIAVMTVGSACAQSAPTAEGVRMNSFYTPTPDDPANPNSTTGQHGLLTLESYVAGSQITTHTAYDIVLILDESSSMDEVIYEAMEVSYTYNTFPSSPALYYYDGKSYRELTRAEGYYNSKYVYCLKYKTHSSGDYYLTPDGNASKTPPNIYSSSDVVYKGVLYKKTTTVKKAALVSAVKSFVELIQKSAVANNVKHRISIVGFSNENSRIISLTSPKLKSSAADADYKNSLVSVVEDSNLLKNAINSITTYSGTWADYGMEMAVKVFAANPIAANDERQRMVLMFTDGEPTGIAENDPPTDFSHANPAIAYAKTLKNTYNAKVYSVAICESADPTADFSGTSKKDCMNRYMHYMSSNYKNAESMSTSVGSKDNDGYYMVATNASQLDSIFKKIAVENVVGGAYNKMVTETSVSKGVLSAYFKLPDNIKTEDVMVYVAPCIGKNDNPTSTFDSLIFGDRVSVYPNVINPLFPVVPAVDKAIKTVSSTGFNYSENWCGPAIEDNAPGNMQRKASTIYCGYKLVMVFPVEIDEGGLYVLWKDGDHTADIDINTVASGLYNGETDEMIAPYSVFKHTVISPLPVELLSFHAECIDNAIQFTWSTATETNNEYFTLERSEDAIHYTEIARIQGAGTSAYRQDYSFMADNNTNHTMYYRLRQTDIDGTTEVFEPIAVQCNATGAASVNVFPVPAKNYVTLQSNEEMESIQLYNVYGAMVNTMEVNANNATINVASMAAGIYTVNITMATGEHITKKLIKH